MNNAAKYTEEGGNIALDIARTGEEAIFRVRDNGIGISREKLSAIFDLFTQADHSLARSNGGLGIGLTLVRRLVEMHGGTVEAFSEGANAGSEFVIHLPAVAAPKSAGRTRQGPGMESAIAQSRRILVVDDYPSVAETLMKVLRLGGHDVKIARDGPSAVEEVSNDRPEIVLLDIGLPGMDGYEVAQRMRDIPGMEETVLIALTGYGQDEDRRRSTEAGFDYHVTKPVDASALFRLLASARGRLEPSTAPSSHPASP